MIDLQTGFFGADEMKKGIVTPLGEVLVFVDNVLTEYDFEPVNREIRSLQERPVSASYQITVSAKEWQTIRCEVSFKDAELPNNGESGERYLCSEFAKENIVLTIGAGNDIDLFDTKRTRYGIEYIRRKPVEQVLFGVAWTTDYEGKDDIRTQLATDLY